MEGAGDSDYAPPSISGHGKCTFFNYFIHNWFILGFRYDIALKHSSTVIKIANMSALHPSPPIFLSLDGVLELFLLNFVCVKGWVISDLPVGGWLLLKNVVFEENWRWNLSFQDGALLVTRDYITSEDRSELGLNTGTRTEQWIKKLNNLGRCKELSYLTSGKTKIWEGRLLGPSKKPERNSVWEFVNITTAHTDTKILIPVCSVQSYSLIGGRNDAYGWLCSIENRVSTEAKMCTLTEK